MTPGAGLEGQRDQLVEKLGTLHVDDLAETQDDNFADGGQVAAEQDEIMALANDLRGQLDDVQRCARQARRRQLRGGARCAATRSPTTGSKPCRPRGSACSTPAEGRWPRSPT